MRKNEKCYTCIYRASANNPWLCEYISIIGHSRGCEPGNLCTKYIKGDRILSNNSKDTLVNLIKSKKPCTWKFIPSMNEWYLNNKKIKI